MLTLPDILEFIGQLICTVTEPTVRCPNKLQNVSPRGVPRKFRFVEQFIYPIYSIILQVIHIVNRKTKIFIITNTPLSEKFK